MLLINLIPYLVKSNLVKVRLYDYSFGVVRLELNERKVEGYEFISLDGSGWEMPNLGDETFILTGSLWLKYPHFFQKKENVKIAVWDVYFPMWESLAKFKRINIPGLKKYLMTTLAQKNAVFFMEEKGLMLFQREGLYLDKGKEVLVPVPVYTKDENLYLERYSLSKKNKVDSIAYIGRATEWKMFPVKKLIKDLGGLDKEFKVLLYTNDEVAFSEFLGGIPSNISVVYKTGLSGKNLEYDLLASNIKFGFAMGTAALDMAKLGIPTILADFAHSEFPEDYSYRPLHGSRLGSLGENAWDVGSESRYGIDELLSHDLTEWSIKSFNYVIREHSINEIAASLVRVSLNTELTLSDIKGLIFIPHYVQYSYKRLFKKSERYYGWGLT